MRASGERTDRERAVLPPPLRLQAEAATTLRLRAHLHRPRVRPQRQHARHEAHEVVELVFDRPVNEWTNQGREGGSQLIG